MLVLSECYMYLLYRCTLAVSKSFSTSVEKKYYYFCIKYSRSYIRPGGNNQ